MNTEEQIAEARGEWTRQAGAEFDHFMSLCESPIERLFLCAVLAGTDDEPDDDTESGEGYVEPEFYPRFPWIRITGQLTWVSAREWVVRTHGIAAPVNMFASSDYYPDDRFWEIMVPQVEVATPSGLFRVDFALLDRTSRIAIELDGHDFHERTKEQAQRDKARDRALTRAGWRVVRFTGSEVFADANRCFDEALALCHSLRERLPRRQP